LTPVCPRKPNRREHQKRQSPSTNFWYIVLDLLTDKHYTFGVTSEILKEPSAAERKKITKEVLAAFAKGSVRVPGEQALLVWFWKCHWAQVEPHVRMLVQIMAATGNHQWERRRAQ
jgi:hypothetical protein